VKPASRRTPKPHDVWSNTASLMKDHVVVERVGYGTKKPVPLEGVLYVTVRRDYPNGIVRSRVRLDSFKRQYRYVGREETPK